MLIRLLKKIGIVFVELAIIAILLLFLYDKNGSNDSNQIIPILQDLTKQSFNGTTQEIEKKIVPSLTSPITKTFNWEYGGENYALTETLYQSLYDFYKTKPKFFSYVGELNEDWEDEYYGMFLTRSENDILIPNLSEKLINIGKKHNLNDDQIVDFVLSFVQSIQYDDAKAKNILAKTANETMLYPYETLFEQAGVCSDKSLLAISILREMGYGAAIFAYEDDNHMAIGIQCPEKHSTYGSGYCYAETTAEGNKIGIIPTFDSESNKAVNVDDLANLESAQSQNANIGQLGKVTIYQKTLGREYDGIIQTQKIIQEIETLKKKIETSFAEIQSQKKKITKNGQKLKEMSDELDKMYKDDLNIEKYNELVGKYNDFFEDYKKDVKKYNNNIELYNKTIARYNILIKQ